MELDLFVKLNENDEVPVEQSEEQELILGQTATGDVFYIAPLEDHFVVKDAEGNEVWNSKEESTPNDPTSFLMNVLDQLEIPLVSKDVLLKFSLLKANEEPAEENPEENPNEPPPAGEEPPVERTVDKLRKNAGLV